MSSEGGVHAFSPKIGRVGTCNLVEPNSPRGVPPLVVSRLLVLLHYKLQITPRRMVPFNYCTITITTLHAFPPKLGV